MELTREQKLALRKAIEIKYADILKDESHPMFDDVRSAMMMPGVDLQKINWHPNYTKFEITDAEKQRDAVIEFIDNMPSHMD